MNNIYIIEEVLSDNPYDYTPGMAVICASSLDRCREIFVEEFSNIHYPNENYFEREHKEFDSAINDRNYKVIEGVNHDEGIVSYVYGGG